MTSKLKCPVCDVPLTECGDLLSCPNDHCGWVGNAALWQALIQAKQDLDFFIKEQVRTQTALIERTKELDKCQKDLEIAKSYVKGISQTVINSGDNIYIVIGHFKQLAEQTLKQIEHKEQI